MTHADAIGYAQILLAMLLFALSAPAYMIATVDGRVRHLLHRYGLFRGVELFAAFTVIAVMVILTLSYVSPHLIDAPAEFGVGIAVLVLLTFFPMMTLTGTADPHRELVRRINKRLSASRQRRGTDDEHLENLVTVGASSAPGREKHEVLACLQALAQRSLPDAHDVDLDILSIVHGLGRVVLDDARPGSNDNLRDAVDVLRQCWVLIEEAQRTHGREAAALRETLCSIGEAAIRRHADELAVACLHAVGTRNVAFRLGRAAVRGGRVQVAVVAMSRLAVHARVFMLQDLQPPPAHEARSEGRFNHYGQSVFYLGGTQRAALRETVDINGEERVAWLQEFSVGEIERRTGEVEAAHVAGTADRESETPCCLVHDPAAPRIPPTC